MIHRLQKLNLLQRALISDMSLDEKFKNITDSVVEIFDADFCRIWIKGPGDICDKGCIHANAKDPEKLCRKREPCLHLIASSGRYTHIDGPHRRVPFGFYKIGRIANGQADKFLTNDVEHDPQIGDHEWAKRLDLVSFAGYKLQDTNGRPIGVLALFSKQAITSEEDAMLEGLAGMAAHVIQTTQAEVALKVERDKLTNIMESMNDGVYIVNQTYDIEYINPVIEREFGPVQGRKCYEYLHGRDAVCPWCKNKDVFAGKTVQWEWHSDKNNKTYDLLDTLLRNSDGTISKLEIFRDVTERKRAEQELALFRALLDRSNDAIEVVEPATGRFLDMNERGLLDLGYSREELPFLRVWDIDPTVDQDSFTKIIDGLRKSGSITLNSHHQRKDGSQFPVEINIKYVQLDRDYVITVVRDVTERKRAEDALLTSEEKFRGLAEQSIVGACIIQDGKFVYVNQHLAEVLDFRQEEMLGLTVLDLVAERDKDTVKENMRKRISGEVSNIRYTFHALKKDGSEVPMEVYGSAMKYLGRPAIIATLLDITERKAAEKKIKHMAYHDPLTDLPNRTLFYDRLNQAILYGHRENEPVALLFLDVDRFKEINDTHGHDCGDFLLKQFGNRLREVLRGSDTVARLGGDEFAIILPRPEKLEGAVRTARKIMEAMSSPFNLVKTQVNLTVSIGIAVFPEHGEDTHILLQWADNAMYKAKQSGKGFVVYASGEEQI